MTKHSAKIVKNKDQKLVQPNPYLETQRSHKKWYSSNIMGKQRGKPKYDMAARDHLKTKKEKI